MIPISQLENNTGQITGLPKNPRFIKDERYKKLLKSLQDLPEMMDLRPLLVYKVGKKWVVIGGNMRLRALSELKYTEVPCVEISAKIGAEKLKEIAIKDNVAFGTDDWDLIANEWNVDQLSDWGLEGVKGKEISFTPKLPETKWFLNIELPNEKETEKWFKELTKKGLNCKIVN